MLLFKCSFRYCTLFADLNGSFMTNMCIYFQYSTVGSTESVHWKGKRSKKSKVSQMVCVFAKVPRAFLFIPIS